MDLLALLRDLPDEALVPVGWLRQQVEDTGKPGPTSDVAIDMTVQETAHRLGRSASTVRGWCAAGLLPNAYRLRGREWRIPVASIVALQRAEAERAHTRPASAGADKTDVGAWRRYLRQA